MTRKREDAELATSVLKRICGGVCTQVIGHPYSWDFTFGKFLLHVECSWRIVNAQALLVTSADHDQQFGLAEPVDALAIARSTLIDQEITDVVLGKIAADLRISFANGAELQILQNSSGYEAWSLSGSDRDLLVALGGGDLAVWTEAGGSTLS
jgi:hypothetical protein